MPEEAALDMLRFVKRIVRDQQRCPNCDGRADDKVGGRRRRPTHPRSAARPICAPAHPACASGLTQAMGALHPLSPTELASRCACCWHVDFVGGARRRGRAGHDADLLVWHKQKAASWGSGRPHCTLRLQPHVFEAATPCVRGCSPIFEAPTLCIRGCDAMCKRLRPCVQRLRPYVAAGRTAGEESGEKSGASPPTLTRQHCVLGLLLNELERLGRLVPQQGGW